MAIATITPDQNAVIAEVFIAAPPARVFQAISDPAQLPKWWGQTGMYHVTKSTMDVRPGGKWRSDGVGADGKTFYVEGEYLEVDPPSYSFTPGLAAIRVLPRPSSGGSLSPNGERLAPQRSKEIRDRNVGSRSPGRVRRKSGPC